MGARRTAGGWIPDSGWDVEPVEVSRHVSALKRTWPVIVAIVISMTVAVFVVSTLVPDVYEAKARIVMDDRPGAFEPGDAETVQRRLSTVREMLLTRQVLTRAAAGLRNESPESLEDKVSSSVDQDANFVDVGAADATAKGAAAIANAVARSFLAIDAAAERGRLARARTQLERSLDEARGSAERRAIQERLSELQDQCRGGGLQSRPRRAGSPTRKPELPASGSKRRVRVRGGHVPRRPRRSRARPPRTTHHRRSGVEPPRSCADRRRGAGRQKPQRAASRVGSVRRAPELRGRAAAA